MRFGSRGRSVPILPTVYREPSTSSSDESNDLKQSSKCCGIQLFGYAVAIASMEIIISFVSILYTIAGLYSYPDYKAGIIFQDDMFLEAKKQYCGSQSKIPMSLLYCDLFVFTMELFLALALFRGVVWKKLGQIHFWLSAMVIYTVSLTGIFLGFVVGGISSSNLALMGLLHAFFRFFEISIIYAFFEDLSEKREQERRLLDNNNSGSSEVCAHSAVMSSDNAINYDMTRAHPDMQFPFP